SGRGRSEVAGNFGPLRGLTRRVRACRRTPPSKFCSDVILSPTGGNILHGRQGTSRVGPTCFAEGDTDITQRPVAWPDGSGKLFGKIAIGYQLSVISPYRKPSRAGKGRSIQPRIGYTDRSEEPLLS